LDAKDILQDLFKEFVWKPLAKKAVSELLSDLAGVGRFFTWGPVVHFITVIAEKLFEKMYLYLDQFIDLKAVIIKDIVQRKVMTEAVIELKNLALQKGIDSDEYKNQRQIHGDYLLKYVSVNRVSET